MHGGNKCKMPCSESVPSHVRRMPSLLKPDNFSHLPTYKLALNRPIYTRGFEFYIVRRGFIPHGYIKSLGQHDNLRRRLQFMKTNENIFIPETTIITLYLYGRMVK